MVCGRSTQRTMSLESWVCLAWLLRIGKHLLFLFLWFFQLIMLFSLIGTLVQPSLAVSSNPAQACPLETEFQLVEEKLMAPQKHGDQSPAITPHPHICTHTCSHCSCTWTCTHRTKRKKNTKSQVLRILKWKGLSLIYFSQDIFPVCSFEMKQSSLSETWILRFSETSFTHLTNTCWSITLRHCFYSAVEDTRVC